jgi:glycosyltransferase involved in cell wall biosynthesis
MNILYIIGEMGYGGAELLTSQLAIRMTDKGCRVVIAVLGFCEPEVVAATEDAGVRIVRFNIRLLSPANVWRIIKLVKNDQFDVVHVHLFPALYWGAIARIFCDNGSRWIYTEHSTSNRRRQYTILKLFERLVYRAYDEIVCISYAAQRELLRWLPCLDKTIVVESGIDLKRFRQATPISRASLGFTESDMMILMVGAFRTEKNQAALVSAMRFLPKEYKLVLAGDGPELEKVKKLASTLNLTTRVSFIGAVRNVERLMKSADVYVLPSLFEGFGLSAVEAAAVGLPVVYANVPGLADLFAGFGIPVDPRKPESIARGILLAMSGKDGNHGFAEKSIAVAAHFDFERTLMNYRRIYASEF